MIWSKLATKGIFCGLTRNLASPSFTLMCRVFRYGNGTTVTTGGGGHAAIEPIFTGGNAQDETRGNNCAWFLGWIPASSKFATDFEDWNNGLNHPFTFTAARSNNTSYHVAATYNCSSSLNTGSWTGYVNGISDGTLNINNTNIAIRVPDTSSNQGIGIGCAIVTSLAKTGVFSGSISQVAYFNRALSAAEVASVANSNNMYAPLQIPNCTAFWPCDDINNNTTLNTTIIRDRAGNNNGTALTCSGISENVLSYY